MARKSVSIHDEVVRLAREHFGPESAQNLSRLIGTHLGRSPHDMTKDELTSLMDWIKSAVACIDEDKDVIEKYLDRLVALADPASSGDAA